LAGKARQLRNFNHAVVFFLRDLATRSAKRKTHEKDDFRGGARVRHGSVATPETPDAAAPVEGANSFTEAQARERIEAAGFTGIADLKLDDQGVWQATAMKDGKSMPVAMDYQGNVVSK
jgi:hypothetical protein